MNENLKDNLDWVIMALNFKFGWALGYSTWRGLLGVLAPMFRNYIEKFLAGLVPEDRTWVLAFLNNRAWRIFRAACVGLTAIQLPSVESVTAALAAKRSKNGDTATISK